MNSQIYEEASEWLIEFRTDEADAAKRRQFQDWLDNSPEHVRAYLELTAVWEDSARIDRARGIDVSAMIAASRAEKNVVELGSGAIPVQLATERNAAERAPKMAASGQTNDGRHGFAQRNLQGSVRARWRHAIAATVILGAGVAAWGWHQLARGGYSTDVGQQRTLALPDGTAVELNADTRIRERYSDGQRTVELLRGQALFRVAKDPARPFVVVTDRTAVRAVGTEFDVHRSDERTTITVLEGRVAISGANVAAASPIPSSPVASASNKQDLLLDAGQQITVTAHAVAPPTRANISIATAWTRQKLIFEAATLAQAAEEFNRFNVRKLSVKPAGLEDFRINGTFPALDPASLGRFLSFLRGQPGIAVIESGDRIRIEKTGSPNSANRAL